MTFGRLVNSFPLPTMEPDFFFWILQIPAVLEKSQSSFLHMASGHPQYLPISGLPDGDYLRVELVLEPDHATSCQCFQPKQQLLEHLKQLMGRAPTKRPGSREWVET